MVNVKIFILVFLLLLPCVSAREKLKIDLDINSWYESNDENNYSRITFKVEGSNEDVELEIDDEKIFKIENVTGWNGTLTLRFDVSDSIICDENLENLTETILYECQQKTQELENARKEVETNKNNCDKQLANCTGDLGAFSEKISDYNIMERDYKNCNSQLGNCTSVRDDCEKNKSNNIWYFIGIFIIGWAIGSYYGIEKLKKAFKGGGSTQESKESPHTLPDKFPDEE